MKPIKQGSVLTASVDFQFRNPGTRRIVHVKQGSRWTVTNPMHSQQMYGVIKIDRDKKAKLNLGYCFDWDQMVQFFGVNNLPQSFHQY